MRLVMIAVLIVCAGPAGAGEGSPVVAQPGEGDGRAGSPQVAQARTQYQAGVRHYNLADFQQALGEFKSAYELHPDPALLFNIGQCHRMLGHTQDAVYAYRAYLREVPDASNRDEVERLRAQLEDELRRAHANPPPASPSLAPPAVTASTAPTPTGETIDARPPSSPAHAQDAPQPLYKKWWLWTAVGVAVVAIAVGVGVGTAPATNAPNPGGTAGSMTVHF